MSKTALFFAMVAFFFAGAWFEDEERKAATWAALFGLFMLAIALGGCK
jgi:hypothetical protein